MKAKRVLGLLLTAAMTVGMFAGCGNDAEGNTGQQGGAQGSGGAEEKEDGNAGSDGETQLPFYMTLDPEVGGEIDIMTWSGDGLYHTDLGRWDASVQDDLTGGTLATIYAMAKKFNERYPNVKINLYAKNGSENGNDTTWSQELENFKAEHGKYPDIYCSVMLPKDVEDGMVADLSIYKEDPLYQSFNPSLMEMMNYYGVQAGLPWYLLPWGIWVNRELAEVNNIDAPDPDWTMDEYTEFVTSADNTKFWGTIYGTSATQLIGTGVDTVNAALKEGKEIDIASDQVMSLLDYIPQWSSSEIWAKNNEGAIDQAIMEDGWWWAYRFFCRNYCLTSNGDPWFLTTAAMGQNEDGTWAPNAVESNDWDVYPRPSTDYRGNNIGAITDPIALHNYAMDDGDLTLSDAEKEKLDLAYAFASFWCGSTEAMEARLEQQFNDNGTIKSALNDSFPLVVGDEFDKQMELWYKGDGHERYADKDLMPGFQYVLQLWQEGAIYDYSDKCYPCRIMVDGTEQDCLYEWNNMTRKEVAGVAENDPGWLDAIKANLPDWNEKTRERLATAQENLKNGLKKYYGLTDSDF